jgi:hypothetical protein
MAAIKQEYQRQHPGITAITQEYQRQHPGITAIKQEYQRQHPGITAIKQENQRQHTGITETTPTYYSYKTFKYQFSTHTPIKDLYTINMLF